MLRKATYAALLALGFHAGYKLVSGKCPCGLRKGLQLKLAMLLLWELEKEGFLDLEKVDFEDEIPEDWLVGDA